jgi:hypothetical protein
MGLARNRLEVSGCKVTTLFCILNMWTMKKQIGYQCVTSHYYIMDMLLEILGIMSFFLLQLEGQNMVRRYSQTTRMLVSVAADGMVPPSQLFHCSQA